MKPNNIFLVLYGNFRKHYLRYRNKRILIITYDYWVICYFVALREGVAKVAPSYFGDFLQGVAGRLAQDTTLQKPQNCWDYLAKTDGFGKGFRKGKAGTPKNYKLCISF